MNFHAKALILCAALALPSMSAPSAPSGLTVNLLSYPEKTFVGKQKLFFGWIVNDDKLNAIQSAYEIQVAQTLESLQSGSGDLWNSGKVSSSKSQSIPYGGSGLNTVSGCYWRVRTFDVSGTPGPYSTPQKINFTWPASSSPTPPMGRYLTEETLIQPANFISKGSNNYFIEFPKAAYGTVSFRLTSANGGEVISVKLGEKRSGNSVDEQPGYDIRYANVRLTLQKGTRDYRLEVPRGGWGGGIKDMLYTCIPFRYVELLGVPGDFTSSDILQRANIYPFNDSASHFSCNNETMNAVWDLCKYTMKATSWVGIYVDGDRERVPYEADAYINQLGHYCTDREYVMARYSMIYLTTHPTWPTEWGLHMIFMAWADYQFTGNSDYLRVVYAGLVSKMLKNERQDGLVITDPSKDIVDWPAVNRDGHQMMSCNTVLNAFHYRTLVLMKEIAKVLNNTADAITFENKATRVKNAFNQAFYNPATGKYIDGVGSTHSSLHSNAFPLAFGLVPDHQKASVVSFVKSKKMSVGVYGAQYLLEGLYEAGEDTAAYDLMAETVDERSWWNMIKMGSTMTLECWTGDYSNGFFDWNHAWGAAPANIIPRYLMGIIPLEPGFTRVKIKPQIGRLTECSVTLPTLAGPIFESLKKSGSMVTMNLQLPANVSAQVYFPKSATSGTSVIMDGRSVTGRDEGSFIVLDSVGSGKHVITNDPSMTAATRQSNQFRMPKVIIDRKGIAVTNDNNHPVSVRIVSLNGQLVSNTIVGKSSKTIITVNNLAKGSYVVYLTAKEMTKIQNGYNLKLIY